MPVFFYNPETWTPDQGELPQNTGWVESENLSPYGSRQLLIPPLFTERVQLSSGDIRGRGTHPSNGTAGWMLYYASNNKLYEIDPSTWTENDRSGAASFTPDAASGTRILAYGPHVVSCNGHTDAVQIQVNGAGNFTGLITNAEPETSTGNWPPKAKHMALWGPHVAIGNLTDVGPASAFGNTCGFLWWISSAENGRTFGTLNDDAYAGQRTTYDYLADDHGDITGMWGGREFGVVGKTTAMYRVDYGGALLVEILQVSQGLGTIWPNGGVWAQDEFYFMSTSGPAKLGRGGPPIPLATDQALRTLFDETWILDTFTINTDQSLAYMLWATYHPPTETVVWFYRSTADTPERWLAYHIPSARFSSGECLKLSESLGTAFTSQTLSAITTPRLEATRFTAFQGLVLFGKDDVGNGELYTADPAGNFRWVHRPKLRSPWLVLQRDGEDRPMRTEVVSVRPYYSLNAGVVDNDRPTITIAAESKNKPGTTETAGSSLTADTEDGDGKYHLPKQQEGLFHRFQIDYGDSATVSKIENLADIFAGLEIEYDVRGQGI